MELRLWVVLVLLQVLLLEQVKVVVSILGEARVEGLVQAEVERVRVRRLMSSLGEAHRDFWPDLFATAMES